MKKNRKKENAVIVEPTNTKNNEFNKLQALVLNQAKKRSNAQRKTIDLLALQYQMEDYLNSKKDEAKLVGDFLKDHLSTLKIKQNKFANYIDLQPSNLSKLIKGERSLSHELALVFGKIFGNDPMLWLDIQDKNKLMEIAKRKKNKLKKYSLNDLI